MKNKICYIVLFVLLFSFIVGNSVFAYSINGNNCVLTIPDELYQNIINSEYYNSYEMIFVNNSNTCYDVFFIEHDEDLYFYITDSGNISSNKSFNCVHLTYSHDDLSLLGTFEGENIYVDNWRNNVSSSDSTYDLYLKNVSLYTDVNKTDFFLKAPVGTLAPIVKKVETEKTLEEVVLILPIILLTLVGLIGLRKALRMLSTVLSQS